MNTQTTLDTAAFRRALGNFATGVTVMTARHGERRTGMTANSFNSVSLNPPLILWSIIKTSRSYEIFGQADHFAVNVLAADQIALSNHFARYSEDKFDGIEIETASCGTPLLPGCAARFVCEQYQCLDGGDHWILLGKVIHFDDFGRTPLLYHQGAYSAVLPHPRLRAQTPASENGTGQGRLSENLYYLMTQAVRRYQADYQPRQLASGFHTNEARLLLGLHSGAATSAALLQRVAVSAHEIGPALEILHRRGLLQTDTNGQHYLTTAGMEQAQTLWQIADEQQARVFKDFTPAQIDAFRDMLRHVCVNVSA